MQSPVRLLLRLWTGSKQVSFLGDEIIPFLSRERLLGLLPVNCVSGCWCSVIRSTAYVKASKLEKPREDADQLHTGGLSESDGVGVGEVEARCEFPHVPQQDTLVVVEHVVVFVVIDGCCCTVVVAVPVVGVDAGRIRIR